MLPKIKPDQYVIPGDKFTELPKGYTKPVFHPITKVPLAGTRILETPSPQTAIPSDINPTTGVTLAGMGDTKTSLTVSKNDVSTILPNIVPKHGRKSRYIGGQWVVLLGLVGAAASIYTVAKARR